jgi:poly(3-hydroxybutyrate) depolymerase
MGRMKRVGSMMVVAAALAAAGCSNKLETGYEPRTIGSNETERRGYYAAPFSKEAREARQKADYDTDVRRPTPGY